MRVSLFPTCLADWLYPEVGMCVARILAHYGCDVDVPEKAVCCGQPAYNSGYTSEARVVASRLLESFRDSEYVVVPSGSCGGMIRGHFPELFAGDPELRQEAEALAGRVYEFSQFMVTVLGVERVEGSFPHRVTYHPSCHAARLLGVRDEPLALLRAVPDLELVPLSHADDCCGFGGTFAVKLSAISAAIADEKVSHVADSGARFVVSTDLGCLMNIAGRASRRGTELEALHVAEVLARALENGGGAAR